MRTSRAWAAVAVMGAVGLAVGTATAPAVAASSPGTSTHQTTGATAAAVTNSPNRAGLVAVPGVRAIHLTSATWIVPALTCGKQDARAQLLVRLDDDGSAAPLTLGVTATCSAGKASYYGWFTDHGRSRLTGRRSHRINAHDEVEVSIYASRTGAGFKLVDDTQGWGVGVSSSGETLPAMHRALFLVTSASARGSRVPLPDFGRVHFLQATAASTPLDQLAPRRIVMRTAAGVTRAVPHGPTDRGAFTVSWRHA